MSDMIDGNRLQDTVGIDLPTADRFGQFWKPERSGAFNDGQFPHARCVSAGDGEAHSVGAELYSEGALAVAQALRERQPAGDIEDPDTVVGPHNRHLGAVVTE